LRLDPVASEAGEERAAPPASVAYALLHPVAGPLLIAVTCLAVFFTGLGAPPLLDPDEGRHAEVAREMLVSGNWLTPTLDFEPYRDKPALFYWLAASSMSLFGVDEWAARLPSAVAACLGVLATVWWGSRFFGRLTGMLAGLILATSGIYIGLGRFVMIDMTFTLWLSAALFWGGAWFLSPARRRPPAWPAFVFLSLATLTKGPLAVVLAALTLGTFALQPQRLSRLRQARLAGGLALLALLGGSWYAACAVVAPHYLREFLWHDNIQRFLTGAGGHADNAFAYLYWLPLVFFPWSLYLPSLFHDLRSRRSTGARELCILWFACGFFVLSLSQGKLATYLLPLLPPLALLTADALASAMRGATADRLVAINHRWAPLGAGAFLLVAAALGTLFLLAHRPEDLPRLAFCLLGIPPLVLASRAAARGRRDAGPAVLFVLTVLTAAAGYVIATPVLREVYSLKPAADLLAGVPDEVRVVTLRARAHSLRFYLERDVEAVQSPAQASARLSAAVPTVLLTKASLLESVQSRTGERFPLWWAGQRKKVLLANRPLPWVTAVAAAAEENACNTTPGGAIGSAWGAPSVGATR
jgi:4-amino-4-deoxy-L-arabinose transferase-like glycosyltransferase